MADDHAPVRLDRPHHAARGPDAVVERDTGRKDAEAPAIVVVEEVVAAIHLHDLVVDDAGPSHTVIFAAFDAAIDVIAILPARLAYSRVAVRR